MRQSIAVRNIGSAIAKRAESAPLARFAALQRRRAETNPRVDADADAGAHSLGEAIADRAFPICQARLASRSEDKDLL
jgi:hypothetical protein